MNKPSRSSILGYVFGVVTGVLAVVGALGFRAAHRYHGHIHPQLPTALTANDVQLEKLDPTVDEILEGNPNYMGKTFAFGHDGATAHGLFEADGPSKFTWRYDTDETIFILEGKVHIAYEGHSFTLEPGDSAFFPSGITTTWTVPEHIRKTWFVSDPGHVVRTMRKLDPWAIEVTVTDATGNVKID